jgi:hypothetical protein
VISALRASPSGRAQPGEPEHLPRPVHPHALAPWGVRGAASPAGDPNAGGFFCSGVRGESVMRNLVYRADGKMVNVVRRQGQLLVCTG